MSAGYQQVLDRLSGFTGMSPAELGSSVDNLRVALESYYFKYCSDEISRSNNWETFVLPSLLLVLHDHLSCDAVRVRCNEYFFCELPDRLSSDSVREHAVLGALAGLIDAGSVPSHELPVDDLQSLFYDLFPNLETFLTDSSPVGPFVPHVVDLSTLSLYLVSISVGFINISYMFIYL